MGAKASTTKPFQSQKSKTPNDISALVRPGSDKELLFVPGRTDVDVVNFGPKEHITKDRDVEASKDPKGDSDRAEAEV